MQFRPESAVELPDKLIQEIRGCQARLVEQGASAPCHHIFRINPRIALTYRTQSIARFLTVMHSQKSDTNLDTTYDIIILNKNSTLV
jgi:hypothetical protein